MTILDTIWHKDRGIGEAPVAIDWPSGDVEIKINKRAGLVFHFWTKNQKLFAFSKTIEIDQTVNFNIPVNPCYLYITEHELDTMIDKVSVDGIRITGVPAPAGAFKTVEKCKYPRYKIVFRKIKRMLRKISKSIKGYFGIIE